MLSLILIPISEFRFVSEFIDFESEVVDSNDSYSDDIEDTQQEMENYSQTIVDNSIILDNQPIGQLFGGIDSRRAKDMHSVYLRSVKDQMIGKTEKYKLQFNYDPNLEVYSQEPTDEELADYEMDSFCVPNDFIESEESSPQTDIALTQTPIQSPALQVIKRGGKRFKRIIFSP